MLKIGNFAVPSPAQWEMTIEGMRSAMNSWDRSDSRKLWGDPYCAPDDFDLGPNDRDLAMRLNKGGAPHAKYRRYLPVHVTVTAPLYWWKEFETYRIGVASNPSDIEFNSCSTMHKIHAKPFSREDFSTEHIINDINKLDEVLDMDDFDLTALNVMDCNISMLNILRTNFIETKDKKYWYSMIQLLPSSYNQRRTIKMNYQVLYEIYEWRRNHKLDEWHTFCHWIEELPYSELIIGEK